MRHYLLAAALASAVFIAPARAETGPSWPADMIGWLQGRWLSETSLEAIEVRGHDVFIVQHSQFDGIYRDMPDGSKIAVLGEVDPSRSSDNWRMLNGTCIDPLSGMRPGQCNVSVNQAGTPITARLTVRERYWREAQMSAFTKQHRARTTP